MFMRGTSVKLTESKSHGWDAMGCGGWEVTAGAGVRVDEEWMVRRA